MARHILVKVVQGRCPAPQNVHWPNKQSPSEERGIMYQTNMLRDCWPNRHHAGPQRDRIKPTWPTAGFRALPQAWYCCIHAPGW